MLLKDDFAKIKKKKIFEKLKNEKIEKDIFPPAEGWFFWKHSIRSAHESIGEIQ